MKKYFYLLVVISAYCQLGFTQSQTRTATYLNNLNNFRQVYGTQNFTGRARDIASDNNKFVCSSRLTAIEDSASPFTSKSVSSLALQGFGFTIPENATIQNLTIRLRRLAKGTPTVGDHTLSLMKRYSCGESLDPDPCKYGVHWTYEDDEEAAYAGRVYDGVETEYLFTQSGSGSDGGFRHDRAYQWTPAIVNHEYFGVRIDNYPPIGSGFVQICYDLVEVTIDYTMPTAKAKPFAATQSPVLKGVNVFPNPFTTNSTIQFVAAENGNIVVELYNTVGAKIRTLYSGKVEKGKSYKIAAGDSKLPKGAYVYKVSDGKQIQTGRMIKME